MSFIGLIKTLTILWAISAIACGNETTIARATVPIDAAGQPQLQIDLVTWGMGLPIHGISVRHELIDAGDRCVSRFFCPEISSILVPVSEGFYQWRTPNGLTWWLKPGIDYGDGLDRHWLLIESGGNGRVVFGDGGLEFNYRYGRLSALRSKERAVIFRWRGEHTLEIAVAAGGTRTLATATYNQDGTVARIQGENSSFEFQYDKSHRLMAVRDPVMRRTVLCAEYRDELLSGLVTATTSFILAWESPEWQGYEHPFSPVRPVLSYDGFFHYEALASIKGIHISRMSDRRPGLIGR